MKKYSTLILFVAVGLIVTVGNQVFHKPTKLEAVENAAKPSIEKAVPVLYVNNEATKAGEEITSTIDYVLPYPGILPNHPLYFVKELRDRIIELLVVDPVRKAEFYLLQADKWLASGLQFFEKNEDVQAKLIIQKSAERLLKAVTILQAASTSGKPVLSGSLDKFEKAVQKHKQVVSELQTNSKDLGSAVTTYEKVAEITATLR